MAAVSKRMKANVKITIEGDMATVITPEGKKKKLPVEALFDRARPKQLDSGGIPLPPGTVFPYSNGPYTILVHVTPPRAWQFKWIAADSPAPYGKEAKYRTVRIMLPYLVILAVFENYMLTDYSECFFRTAGLKTENDELFYPALLNCSKFVPQEGKPLSWICTQKADKTSFAAEPDPSKRLWASFQELYRCLTDTGFNYSSEHHEASSWFTESTKIDARISTIEEWEQSSEKHPQFVLDVPWLPTGKSVKQVVERIFGNIGIKRNGAVSARDLFRLIVNHGST